MVPAEHRDLKVALIAHREARTQPLAQMLEAGGISVALARSIDAYEKREILDVSLDVLLVDLDGMGSRQLQHLEELIELSQVPILFTEGGTPGEEGWGSQIVRKLVKLAETCAQKGAEQSTGGVLQTATLTSSPAGRAVGAAAGPAQTGTLAARARDEKAHRMTDPDVPGVWVLGASLGGPQALSEFLAALPEDIPISIIIAQHIGESFAPLFVEQLNRVTPLPVNLARDVQAIRSGEVILAPADRRFTVDEKGIVRLDDSPIPCSYKPCVNDVMHQVASCFAQDTGAIVFSGMGEDGADGCRYIAEQGGVVWAQNADSCVISSMPDAARDTGTVSLNATPEQLAACLAQATRKLISEEFR